MGRGRHLHPWSVWGGAVILKVIGAAVSPVHYSLKMHSASKTSHCVQMVCSWIATGRMLQCGRVMYSIAIAYRKCLLCKTTAEMLSLMTIMMVNYVIIMKGETYQKFQKTPLLSWFYYDHAHFHGKCPKLLIKGDFPPGPLALGAVFLDWGRGSCRQLTLTPQGWVMSLFRVMRGDYWKESEGRNEQLSGGSPR